MHADRADRRWDPGRNETETERLDRNWATLLQELRVVQTGVTLLTGFLLTLPFQTGFANLRPDMKVVYLATVGCSIAATVLLVAPVAMHRMLFRRRKLDVLVAVSHRLTLLGLTLLGLALAGVATLIFDLVAGTVAAWIAGVATLAALAGFWFVVPLRNRADPG
ncbi:DUF6328 family protein [Mycolicibacterium thermoresistibile]